MTFSTRQAKRQILSAELRDWSATAAPGESRTMVLKLSPQVDVEALSTQLRDLGAEVVSAGPAVTVANVICNTLDRVSKLPGVVEIDAPQVLFPRNNDPGRDSDP